MQTFEEILQQEMAQPVRIKGSSTPRRPRARSAEITTTTDIMVNDTTMTKRNRQCSPIPKGSVYKDKHNGYYCAEIRVNGERRRFRSRYRGDCETWLEVMRNGGNDTRHRHKACDKPIEDIEAMGGKNPRQIPGFEHYYLCDGGQVYSVKGTTAILLRPQRGRYIRLNEGSDSISVTAERLEYCIDKNISPATLSRCKLSVKRGEAGLQLMDCTDYIRECNRRHYERRWKNAREYYEANVRWNQLLLDYYDGNSERLTDIRQMLNSRREYLENYIKSVLRVSDEVRIKFLCDETISEIMIRVVNQTAIIISPMIYMENLARGTNCRIRECRGKVFNDGNAFHVKGDLSKVSRKKTSFNS